MTGIIRLLVGLPVASVITFLLFMFMQRLILVEEVILAEVKDDVRIVIAEQVEDIVPQHRIPFDETDNKVEPPPPPPQIERQKSKTPTEDMTTIPGALPEFDPPGLDGEVDFNISNRHAQPLVRIPPQYPPRALERGIEGHCNMQFDVTPDGIPVNIVALECSTPLFSRASSRAVERWRYEPEIQNGKAIWRRGVQTRLDYSLDD